MVVKIHIPPEITDLFADVNSCGSLLLHGTKKEDAVNKSLRIADLFADSGESYFCTTVPPFLSIGKEMTSL